MTVLEPEIVHEDARRRLTQLFTANIKQVNLYECRANVTLGNHYHKETVEYFYLLDGHMESNGKPMNPGDLFMFIPEQVHKIETKTDCRFMTFVTKEFNLEAPDLWKS